MTILIRSIPQIKWPNVTSRINMVTLIAPAMGPLVASYIIDLLTWRWLFFSKLPLLLLCLAVSYLWIQEEKPQEITKNFDWAGFTLLTLSLGSLFIGLSEVGKDNVSSHVISSLCITSIALGMAFLWIESKVKHPLIALVFLNISFSVLGTAFNQLLI